MRRFIIEDGNFKVDKVQMCVVNPNGRNPCEIVLKEIEKNIGNHIALWIIYNPLVTGQDTVTLVLNDGQVQVSKWQSDKRSFEKIEAEAICYDDPDRRQECEIIAKAYIPPLSYAVLKVEFYQVGGITKIIGNGFTAFTESTVG